ncbi:MAG: hypothetical protein LM593_03060 [Candidatus Verstraetearchaeota archaeon]|nr:hypothetical protein [Candidatus Verstraetearchaeota archaeon]
MFKKLISFLIIHKNFFKLYEKIIYSLGLLSVPFILISITFLIAYGSIPKILLPSSLDYISFFIIISSFIISIFLHEISHVIILTNRDISNINLGISLRGIIGGFISANIDVKTYNEIILPFYSSGLGLNFLLFLIFLPFFYINSYLHIISVINFWLLFMNGIPAPFVDGGKLFEILSKRVNIELEYISIVIILIWLLIFIIRIFM